MSSGNWSDPPPSPTNPDLLENLRSYLVSEGLVRNPRDPTQQGRLPTCWIAPRRGVPAPGQTEGLSSVEAEPVSQRADGKAGNAIVVALYPATDIPPARYEGWLRYNHVEIFFRGATLPPVLSLENAIRTVINDKRGWTMGSVSVIESLLFTGMQPMGSDPISFNFREEYTFQIENSFVPV